MAKIRVPGRGRPNVTALLYRWPNRPGHAPDRVFDGTFTPRWEFAQERTEEQPRRWHWVAVLDVPLGGADFRDTYPDDGKPPYDYIITLPIDYGSTYSVTFVERIRPTMAGFEFLRMYLDKVKALPWRGRVGIEVGGDAEWAFQPYDEEDFVVINCSQCALIPRRLTLYVTPTITVGSQACLPFTIALEYIGVIGFPGGAALHTWEPVDPFPITIQLIAGNPAMNCTIGDSNPCQWCLSTVRYPQVCGTVPGLLIGCNAIITCDPFSIYFGETVCSEALGSTATVLIQGNETCADATPVAATYRISRPGDIQLNFADRFCDCFPLDGSPQLEYAGNCNWTKSLEFLCQLTAQEPPNPPEFYPALYLATWLLNVSGATATLRLSLSGAGAVIVQWLCTAFDPLGPSAFVFDQYIIGESESPCVFAESLEVKPA